MLMVLIINLETTTSLPKLPFQCTQQPPLVPAASKVADPVMFGRGGLAAHGPRRVRGVAWMSSNDSYAPVESVKKKPSFAGDIVKKKKIFRCRGLERSIQCRCMMVRRAVERIRV